MHFILSSPISSTFYIPERPMRPLVPFLCLAVCAVTGPAFAADNGGERVRNKGVRLAIVGLPTSGDWETSASSGGNNITGDLEVSSAIRVAASFDFYIPKTSVVGFHLGVGPTYSTFESKDKGASSSWKSKSLAYGVLAEPGVSINAGNGFRIEAGIPFGFGAGTTEWNDSGRTSSEPAFYLEAGIMVRPTYMFVFGLEVFAQVGYMVLTETSSHNGWDNTSNLKGVTWGLGGGYRF